MDRQGGIRSKWPIKFGWASGETVIVGDVETGACAGVEAFPVGVQGVDFERIGAEQRNPDRPDFGMGESGEAQHKAETGGD